MYWKQKERKRDRKGVGKEKGNGKSICPFFLTKVKINLHSYSIRCFGPISSLFAFSFFSICVVQLKLKENICQSRIKRCFSLHISENQYTSLHKTFIAGNAIKIESKKIRNEKKRKKDEKEEKRGRKEDEESTRKRVNAFNISKTYVRHLFLHANGIPSFLSKWRSVWIPL